MPQDSGKLSSQNTEFLAFYQKALETPYVPANARNHLIFYKLDAHLALITL